MNRPITSPIIVVTGSDCAFYRTVADARHAVLTPDSRIFDGAGTRVIVGADGQVVASTADGTDELAGVLRAWLGAMDALRESTANWSLELLIRASVDHLGFS